MKNTILKTLAIAVLMMLVFVGCKENETGGTQGNQITGGATTNTEGGSTPTETNPIIIEEPTDGTALDVNALLQKVQCDGVDENMIYVITKETNLMSNYGDTTLPKKWKIYSPTASGLKHLIYFHDIEIKSIEICGKRITLIVDNGEKPIEEVSEEEAQEILNNPLIANGFGMLSNSEGPDSSGSGSMGGASTW